MIPASNVTYNERDQVMECGVCLDSVPVRFAVLRDPHAFVEMLERVQIDHKDCHQYNDARLARNARIFRRKVSQLLRGKTREGSA